MSTVRRDTTAAAPDSGTPAPTRRTPWWRRALASEAALATAAGMMAVVAITIVLRLWEPGIAIPYGYGGDGLWVEQVVKGIIDHGWYFTNRDVGAPFGQQLYDFTGSFGDNLHFAVIKAMTLFSQDPVKVVNGYFVLGFLLCAASACLVLRKLGISRAAAAVAAVLFALLPAHVGVGEGRLMLGAYWSIPLTALLVMRVFGGEPMFARREGGGRLTRWCSRRSLVTAGLCFLIAGSGLYYALFSVMLLLLAAVAVLLVRRDWRATLGGGLAAGIVLVIFVAHVSPSIIHSYRHGANSQLSQRPIGDNSRYATSLSLLVVPVIGHRWAPAAELAAKLETAKLSPGPNENSLSALGLFASLGFLGLLLVAGVPGARRARARAGPAAATALTAFLLGTTGGIGLLVALLVTPDLRAWGRISPLLGFLGLFAVALAYDALRRRAAGRRWRYPVMALLGVVLVAGIADQTTESMVQDYDLARTEYYSDARFVRNIESQLPTDAAVLQLPPAPFPEAGMIQQMVDYSHMRGPLHANTLRFSYGSMKGRVEGDWVRRLSTLPTELALPYYVVAGMRGVWVDRRGYAPDVGAALDGDLRRLLGRDGRPLISEDGHLAFYSLMSYARRWLAGRTSQQLREARDSALRLGNVAAGPGTTPDPASHVPQIVDPRAGGALTVSNPGRYPRTVVVHGRLHTDAAPVTVEATLPDGRQTSLRATREAHPFEFRVRVPAGASVPVRFVAPAARAPVGFPELRGTDTSVAP